MANLAKAKAWLKSSVFLMEFYGFYIRFKMDKIDQMSKELMRYFPVSSKVAIDNPPVIDVFPLEKYFLIAIHDTDPAYLLTCPNPCVRLAMFNNNKP